ncbi:MAG TPA: tryptophan synthase subunit alpha [Gaiellaceae bacterium]
MKTLVVYLMAMPDTPELAEAAVDAGADVLEVGFPFSDPLADGPVIRRAGERALAAGMRTKRCLEVLAEIRERIDVPLVPMTYSSIFDAYGWAELERDARAAGATSLIVPDLPADERPDVRRIQLVAPTSSDERVRLAAAATDGWLYLVTVTGTTGTRDRLSPALAPLAVRTRAVTDKPLYAGFGIANGTHARDAAELVDGVVVGTAAVAAAEEGAAQLASLVRDLRAGLDG